MLQSSGRTCCISKYPIFVGRGTFAHSGNRNITGAVIGDTRDCPGEPHYAQVSPTAIFGRIFDFRNAKFRVWKEGTN